jgi:hypothetical protein
VRQASAERVVFAFASDIVSRLENDISHALIPAELV